MKGRKGAVKIFVETLEDKALELRIIDKPLPKNGEAQINNALVKIVGEKEPEPDPSAVFVVHGRNIQAREALFTFLRSIGLHPLEWSEIVKATNEGSPYVSQILEKAFSTAQAAIILMTPDDEARLSEPFRKPDDPSYETQLTPQARPNVIFEAGMAMGLYPKRTIIVELGVVRPFSDIAGRHILRMDNSTEKRQELADRLRTIGCAVNLSGTDWQSAGNLTIQQPFTR